MLAVVHTIAPALITGFVTRALRQLPMLELALQSIKRDAEIEDLSSSEIDECFCTDPIAGNTKIATKCSVGNCCWRAQGHALASRTSVSLSGLSEQPYLNLSLRIPHARDHPSGRVCDYHDPTVQIRTRGFDSTGRGKGRRRLHATRVLGNRGRSRNSPSTPAWCS